MTKATSITKELFFSFLISFGNLPDPRVDGCITYPMDEILFAVLCGVICGCDDFEEIELFCQDNLEYLRKYLPYKNGIPKEAWLTRLFSKIDGKEFEKCFVKWLTSFQKDLKGNIAIDGKTLRGSRDGDKKAIHVISAFVHEEGVIVGQKKVEDKSNEITAIPELLDQLELNGNIVTIDAIGCQKAITQKIIKKKGDYILSLKENHSKLHQEVKRFFEYHQGLDFKGSGYEFSLSEETDAGHGRIEIRKVVAIDDISWLTYDKPEWKSLKSLIMLESIRIKKTKDFPQTSERRYYLSSLKADAHKMGHAIRGHWSIENNLHWVLDVSFNDDKCRSRKDHAAINFAIIKRSVFNMLKREGSKLSIKCKRKKASWDCEFLTRVLHC